MSSSSSTDPAEAIADLLLRVYEIHERIIVRTGGLPGLRDVQCSMLRLYAHLPPLLDIRKA